MTWNHRVMRRVLRSPAGHREVVYDIREVYYNGKGRSDGYTKDAIAPQGSTLEELRHELTMMLHATYDPIFKHHHALKPSQLKPGQDAKVPKLRRPDRVK